MSLFHDCHEGVSLPPRPTRLPAWLQQRLFAESTQMTRRRRASTLRDQGGKPDEWRNSGGKRAVVVSQVRPELIFDGKGHGLYLARRTGRITRAGEPDLTYHQFNIDRLPTPTSRSGTVTIYHIIPPGSGRSKEAAQWSMAATAAAGGSAAAAAESDLNAFAEAAGAHKRQRTDGAVGAGACSEAALPLDATEPRLAEDYGGDMAADNIAASMNGTGRSAVQNGL